MAPKKKRHPGGTKSNRKSRVALKTDFITAPTPERPILDETIIAEKTDMTDLMNSTEETCNYIEVVTGRQSIDCPEHNEKENIDFDELISVSTIHSGGIKMNDRFIESTMHIPNVGTKDAENVDQENEITAKLSNLNVIEENAENIDLLSMIVDESEENIFNDTKQVIVEECVPEELISVASEQEVESAVTNELEPIIDGTLSNDLEQIQIPEQDAVTVKTEKKPKVSKKKSTKATKPKVNNKKKIVPSTKSKKEVGIKVKGRKGSSKNFYNENSDNSRRRSSRLKTISELKQNQTKLKTDNKSNKSSNDSDVSESSNLEPTDTEKALLELSAFLTSSMYEGEQKPVKVKSRWRRSSELELVNKNAENEQKTEQDKEAEKILANNEEIKKRLKQFVHLKENQYLTGRVTCKEAKKMVCDCVVTAEEMEKGELGCGEDCLNRLLLIECGPLCPVSDKCTNKRFQKSHFSPCEVFRTDKKGLGIRATANILHGEFILEYVGEVIGPDEFEERATEYSKDKNPHYYFMSLRSDAVIDATQKGNISRFINHSCDPNAETQKWTVNGELRIGFFSKRTILAGEEITFDYQFQRYGKEAQKCFCESSLCRGWLGEEPEEDEEDEEEEEEIVTKAVDSQVIEKVDEAPNLQIIPEKQPALPPAEITDDQLPPVLELAVPESIEPTVIPTEIPLPVEDQPPAVKKEKKKTVKRKVLKDMFEDVDVDEELEMLVATGLKNQAQTLKLSRLMVRATEVSQRITLLRVLRRGEFPCRRLFLDYHGLRLIHGWMNEAQQLCATNPKQEALRLGLLQTLVTLPIPNKTMLQDSKVLPTVELWSKKLVDVPPELDSESNSPKLETDSNILEANISKVEAQHISIIHKKEQEMKKEILEPEPDKFEFVTSNEVFEIRRSVGMDIENIRSENLWRAQEDNEKLIQDIIDMFDEDMDISPVAFNDDEHDVKSKIEEPKQDGRDYEVEIIALAKKLLEEWSVLKEVFRIPKKERIEQMKEHEREADRGYKAGLEHYSEKKSGSRYRSLQRSRSRKKLDDNYHSMHARINKHERRKLFAMQVEQEEVERRFKSREVWRQPDIACTSMPNDTIFASPFDLSRNYQLVWNQQSGQWQTFPILNPNIASRFNLGMNFPYPITSSVANVNLGIPTISLPSQSMSNTVPNVPPQVQNLTNMSLPPPNLVHLQQNMHRPPIMTNSIIGMPNTNPNSFPPVPNLTIPTNIPPPSPITLPTNIPPPTTIHPTNIPPPNMQPQPNIPPLPNCPPPNINSHLSVPQSPFSMHQEKVLEVEDVSQVKFAGPIPPPAKLPPKWKCAKDKYGRPYYYHIQIRISQWEPPELPPPVDVEEESTDTSSSSETSSLSSSSSSEDSDDEELDDTKLLLGIRKKFQLLDHKSSLQTAESPEDSKEEFESILNEGNALSLDERLKDEFNLNKKESLGHEPSSKKKRLGLVTEVHIISPRTEDDKILAKENLKKYKENKEKLKRQKELTLEQSKKRVKVTVKSSKQVRKHKSSSKTKLKETMDLNCEAAKKIKETFRSNMAGVMVGILNPYRKAECKEGKITNTEDFKHLARKLTHFVMLKELKHCQNIEDLTCTESVKSKAKEFVRKYMSKFGEVYNKPKDDLEY